MRRISSRHRARTAGQANTWKDHEQRRERSGLRFDLDHLAIITILHEIILYPGPRIATIPPTNGDLQATSAKNRQRQ
jgi:hypothetical protein